MFSLKIDESFIYDDNFFAHIMYKQHNFNGIKFRLFRLIRSLLTIYLLEIKT